MNLIGINGFKTAGKDTTYQIIRDITGVHVERAGYADKLKIIAAKSLGFDGSDEELIRLMDKAKDHWIIHVSESRLPLSDEPWEETFYGEKIKFLTGRQYLQFFGGKAREVFGETFWVDQVLPPPAPPGKSEINAHNLAWRYPDVDILCVTDVRYPNEAERVRDLGGRVWSVQRPGLAPDGHETERMLPPELIDVVIVNDGDLEALTDKVRDALFDGGWS